LSFWAKNRIEIDRKSKFGNRNITMHNFNSKSEQQSIQWNKQINQNCHFTTLRNSSFYTSTADNR